MIADKSFTEKIEKLLFLRQCYNLENEECVSILLSNWLEVD
jgi:hypothetical protein